MTMSLKTRILAAFALIIVLMSVPIAIIGYYMVRLDIIERAQHRVRNDLAAARSIYDRDIESMGSYLRLYRPGVNDEEISEIGRFEYLRTVAADEIADCPSAVARRAGELGRGVGGSRIMSASELDGLDGAEHAIELVETERAYPSDRQVLDDVLAKEYALPIRNESGEIEMVVYGGRIINRNFEIVDRIRHLIYGEELYDGKPVGTVTIFQDAVRVSTNVLKQDGERAIGTQVSQEVYDRVVGDGQVWLDRAFVVTHWYKTGYQPIRNMDGEVIGIIYVGLLEKPFTDMARRLLLLFLAVVAAVVVLGLVSAIILANNISKPVANVLDATASIAGGSLGCQVESETGIEEFDELVSGFNKMSTELYNRDESLRISNRKLEESNKNYVELISFVSHELKGILASAIMNVYSVRDGLLGLVNFKQRKAIDSVARNLDYLDATVKKFLNLGRIEQDRLKISKQQIDLALDVFDQAVESLLPLAKRKKIEVDNRIAAGTSLQADSDMLKVVANNLISNAIKYGREGGAITIDARDSGEKVEVEVYNDSDPIEPEQIERLFKKFSRLENEQTRLQKGSGLGLYISRQIVEKHGGGIKAVPRDNGNSFIFEIEKGE